MLQAIIGALCGVGLFFVLADVYRIPYLKTSKAVESLSKQQKEKTSALNIWLGNLAESLARHMKLNEFKKAQLEADLKTAQMDITPEKFKANAIVSAVKRFSKFVLNDEKAFALELQSLWKDKQEEKPKHNQSELKRCQKRYDELSTLIRGLYENLISGLLPERQYKQLMKQYDDEQAELEAKMETMKKELSEEKDSTMDIQHFVSLIRKYKNPTEVSDLMFTELIDKIVVYESEGVGKAKTQKVDIYFNYVGQVDIAYTEEELAEIKEQEEQEEKKRLEKQRQREKAYREKRKAKKLAENGGEIVKTKVCPHCGKEFTPTSNRQIFCSKDCCYQARQDKTKADREAEKGSHYYRQRVCAVCGSTYWPTHSQQKFCSEECKKVNHNKKTLEFYYKKQKEKELCKDLLQTKEQVSDTNSSEITIIPA